MNDEINLMAERIEMYCDADRRGRIEPGDAKKFCPTIEEAMRFAQ